MKPLYLGLAFILLAAAIGVTVFFIANSELKVEGGPAPIVQTAPTSTALQPLRVLFGGDVFFDRAIRRSIEKRGGDFLWEPLKPLLASYQYKVANLEGPIWETASTTLDTMNFAFQPEHVAKLKELGFTAVSLANNHTLNKGGAGIDNTRAELDKMGLAYFGDPRNKEGLFHWAGEWNGTKIALVGEHNLVPQGREEALADIQDLKAQGYFVIVYPHWGAEYVQTIPDDEQRRARQLVDAGADLVIGAHPHTVQPIEVYKGKAIFYCLGNLLFDQYLQPETMQGLMVGVEFIHGGLENSEELLHFTLYPTAQQLGTYQVSQAAEEIRNAMLKRIAAGSIVPEEVRSGILNGGFELPLE